MQTEVLGLEHLDLYALVASHEAIRMFLTFTTREDIEEEGCDINNTYIFGDLDITIRMRQPTDSTQVAYPGYDCIHK